MAKSSGKAAAKSKNASTPGRAARFAPGVRSGGKLRTFLREVWMELGKVTWPSRADLVQATMVVMVAVAISAAYIGVWDLIWSQLVNLVKLG